MDITIDEDAKIACLKLEKEEEVGLYPMLKNLN